MTVVEDDPADENHKPLAENLARLKTMKDQDGKPLKVVTLPMPAAVEFEGQRLPASYANFYIANRRVLVPTYRCKQDTVGAGDAAAAVSGSAGAGDRLHEAGVGSGRDSLRDAAAAGGVERLRQFRLRDGIWASRKMFVPGRLCSGTRLRGCFGMFRRVETAE